MLLLLIMLPLHTQSAPAESPSSSSTLSLPATRMPLTAPPSCCCSPDPSACGPPGSKAGPHGPRQTNARGPLRSSATPRQASRAEPLDGENGAGVTPPSTLQAHAGRRPALRQNVSLHPRLTMWLLTTLCRSRLSSIACMALLTLGSMHAVERPGLLKKAASGVAIWHWEAFWLGCPGGCWGLHLQCALVASYSWRPCQSCVEQTLPAVSRQTARGTAACRPQHRDGPYRGGDRPFDDHFDHGRGYDDRPFPQERFRRDGPPSPPPERRWALRH